MSAAEETVATQIESSEPTLREEIESAVKEVQARDEQGRFKSKDEPAIKESSYNESDQRILDEPEKVKNSSSGVELTDGKDVVANSEATQAKGDLIAPASWSHSAKSRWNELPPEIKQEVSKRELDMTRGMTKIDDERRFAKEMLSSVQPYQALIQSEGSNAPQYVSQVLNTIYTLRTASQWQKQQVWNALAQQFGIESPQAQQQNDQQAANPYDNRIAQLERQLQMQQQEAERQQQEALQQQHAQALNMIEAFRNDPANKYFDNVRTVMGALMQSGEAKDIKEAYDMAINARPDIRAQLQADQKAKQDAEAAKALKAQQARNKGSSVRGGPGGQIIPPIADRSLREEIMANLAEANGRI